MQDNVLNFGIDVAKNELVVAVADHPQYSKTVPNQASAIQAWLDGLPGDARIAVESTGRYHGLLVELAQADGFAVYVLNARDVHYYARALGQRGKTDRSDAEVISRYLREHHARLHPFAAGTPAEQEIQKLLRSRSRVTVQRQALLRSLEGVVGLQTTALTDELDRVLKQIDQRIAALIASEPELADCARRLGTIPGVGAQGAAWLTCLLRRIPFTGSDAVVAYSGLDPRARDSGQMRGRRRLSKRGPAALRRLLFMMAFSASRSKVFQAEYKAFRARGLSSTAAIVVLARKLLRIAFAVWKTQTTFDADRYLAAKACAQL